MKPLVKIVPPLRIIGILLLVLTGCRKELCYTHDEHSYSVKTHVKADWEQEWERTYYVDWEEVWREEWPREYDEFRPDPGTGIRALVYTDGKNVGIQSGAGRGTSLYVGRYANPALL